MRLGDPLVFLFLVMVCKTSSATEQMFNQTVFVSAVRAKVETVAGTHDNHSFGSGTYVGNGRVLTAYHIVEGSFPDEITVGFAHGEVLRARLEKFDAELDIALLRVLGDVPDTAVKALIRKKPLKVNEDVLLIGHPRSDGSRTQQNGNGVAIRWAVIRGYVTSTHTEASGKPIIALIAPTRHGSSGSPIFRDGSLVGIATANSLPFTFGVPIDQICKKLGCSFRAPVGITAERGSDNEVQDR